MSVVTSHVLNTVTGKPAEGVIVELKTVGSNVKFTAATNNDGRITEWNEQSSTTKFNSGEYVIKFYTREYFKQLDQTCFYPFVEIRFDIDEKEDDHIHIPLLISNYSYTTYKGS
ncbi:hypothetical protein JA1_005144 [Spathaspora sp. JA1]|nr:hypothetical protein JA1_005144 [Spathaspora sp. JA1]